MTELIETTRSGTRFSIFKDASSGAFLRYFCRRRRGTESKLETGGVREDPARCTTSASMHSIQNAENESRREMSTFRRAQTRRIGRKLSPPARRDGKVNCRLCYTSGDDVDSKRLESCRREAESPKKKESRKEKKKEKEKKMSKPGDSCHVKWKYIRISCYIFISSLRYFKGQTTVIYRSKLKNCTEKNSLAIIIKL